MKRFLYIILFTGLIKVDLYAQDPQFTQFYSVPLYLGPSFAGATQQHRVSMSYRKQWVAAGNYNTLVCAYDRYFANYNSGVGLMIMSDQAGTGHLGNSYVYLLYSYDFLIRNTWHVRPGISFITSMNTLDFSRLIFPDQINSERIEPISKETPPSDEVRMNIDGSVSALVYNEKIWFGFTTDHLLRPNLAFYGDKTLTPLKFTIYGGGKIISKGRLLKPLDESISVAFQFKMQGDYKQLDLGLYWLNSPMVFGFWYRGLPQVNSDRGDALAFLGGLKLSHLSIGYSYDFTISNLITSTYGTHEVSVIWEFQTQRKKKYHAIPCPEF
jgi:type IX secretion system PorP/SprF family membrane protein